MQGRLLLRYPQGRKQGGEASPAASEGAAKAAIEEHVEELLRVHLALCGEGPSPALVPAREPRRLRAVPVVRGTLVRVAQAGKGPRHRCTRALSCSGSRSNCWNILLRHEKARDTAACMRLPVQAAAAFVSSS